MEADIDKVKEYYSNLDDNQIQDLLLFESQELTTEAIQVLREEVKSRGFDDDILKVLEIQFAGIKHPAAQKLITRIRNLPCPKCGKRMGNINAARLREVVGVIVFMSESQKTVIACGECISKAAKNSNIVNFIGGWWAVYSIFYTFRAIKNNFKYYHLELAAEPTEYFNELISRNLGILYMYFQEDEDLEALVKNPEIFRGLNIRKAYLEDHGKR